MVLTDLKDFYLGTPMKRYEYMIIPNHMIPDDIMDLYIYKASSTTAMYMSKFARVTI